MANPNLLHSTESIDNNSPTGWESVEAMADEIDHEAVTKIDEYMMQSSENPTVMAHYVADLAGVAASVKPTALIQIMPTELNIDNAKLAELIKNSGLVIANGWEDGKYFISKSEELANQVKEKFHKLWDKSITDEENRDLGRILGYPETAVAQDFSKPQTIVGKIRKSFSKKESPVLARYYTHSPEHQEEEFEAYEEPLHKYLEEYCPQATAILKEEHASNGKKYKW